MIRYCCTTHVVLDQKVMFETLCLLNKEMHVVDVLTDSLGVLLLFNAIGSRGSESDFNELFRVLH